MEETNLTAAETSYFNLIDVLHDCTERLRNQVNGEYVIGKTWVEIVEMMAGEILASRERRNEVRH